MAELQQISLGKLVNNTGQIAGVPKNPRQIRNEQYDRLLQSLKESDLTDYKPLMVYPQGGKFIVLGGLQGETPEEIHQALARVPTALRDIHDKIMRYEEQ